MTLTEDATGWHLQFFDGLVQLLQIDFRLGLFLTDQSEVAKLFIGEPCRLKTATGEVSLTPGDARTLGPALELFNAKVLALDIQRSGHLVLSLKDRSLEVDPHDSYEAWELGCSLGFMMVCEVGGGVSVFDGDRRTTQ